MDGMYNGVVKVELGTKDLVIAMFQRVYPIGELGPAESQLGFVGMGLGVCTSIRGVCKSRSGVCEVYGRVHKDEYGPLTE